MKATTLAAALILVSAAAFALRRGELQGVTQRAEVLRQTAPASSSGARAELSEDAEPAQPSMLAGLKRLFSTPTQDTAAIAAFQTRLAALSPNALHQLIAETRKDPDARLPGILANILQAAGGHDETVCDLLLAIQKSDENAEGRLFGLIDQWLQKDPASVIAWTRRVMAGGSITDEKPRKKLEALTAVAAVMQAPIASLPRLRTLQERDQMELLPAAMLAVKSPAEIRSLAAAVLTWPTAEPRRYVYDATIQKLLSIGDMTSTSAWLDTLPDVTAQQKNEARIALAIKDPDAAAHMPRHAAWVLSKANAAEQPDVAASLTASWIQADHDATGTWLNTNRTAPWYDAAACAFAEGVSGKEPVTGFDWALTISDESLRRKAFKEVMRLWNKDDTATAAAYLEASSLPPDWKQELRAAP